MKSKCFIVFFLMMVLLVVLTACDNSNNNHQDIKGEGQLIISTDLSEVEEIEKNSQEVGTVQSVAEERFSNYKVVVTIEHKDTSEVKTQEKAVGYKENARLSFNDITPGNWEVQAILEADYTGETDHLLQIGEDLNDVKIAECEKVSVEIKENETTTVDQLTLALVDGDIALKIGDAPDKYQLNEIRLLDNNDEIVKTDSTITFGDQVDCWASGLRPSTYHLEVDYTIDGSNKQQDRLLITVPGMTKNIKVEFYNNEAYIEVGWDMPPSVPGKISAQLQEIDEGFNVNINWDEVKNAEKYIIERKVDDGPWEQLTEVSNTEYIDNDIERDKGYQYVVIAVDDSGKSSDRSQPTEEIAIPEKAVFEITNISMSSTVIGQGGSIEISADVLNKANYETAQDIVLEIDFGAEGVVEKTENITLAPSVSDTVVFNVDVPDNADTGETTATVSSDHDSSNQSFYLGLQKITFAEQSKLDGVTISIEDSDDNQVAQVETGSYASGKAVEYLESGDYDYTATIDGFEYSSSFSVADIDKTESFRLNFAGGTGTEANPYLITNWYHLNNLRDYGVTNGSNYQAGTYFALDADLDSSTIGYEQFASSAANSGKGWDPFGDENTAFIGIFDGQENVISDLFIDRDSENYIALFAFAEGSDTRIQNLSLQNVDITGNKYSAGLVGTAGRSNGSTPGGPIENCSVTGSVTGASNTGGLIGFAGNDVVCKDSHTEVTVEGSGNNVGGLIGETSWIDAGVIIENCYALGDVTDVTGDGDNNNIGGLIGQAGSGEIRDSYAKGEVSVSRDYSYNNNIGGLVGNQERDMNIINCYAEGDVSGKLNVAGYGGIGGLVGRGCGTVENSYALGTVKSYGDIELNSGGLIGYVMGTVKNSHALGEVIINYDGYQYVSGVGGLIGFVDYKAVVENCYAAGPVTDQTAAGVQDEDNIGGLVGDNSNIEETTNSYYDKDTTGQSSSDGGIGVSTDEMMQGATFTSWDFTDIWTIDDNSSYPYLQWQNSENIPDPGEDIGAPVWETAPEIGTEADTESVGVSAAIDEAGTVYYQVMDDGAEAPSAEDVRHAGNDTAMTEGEEKEITISRLDSGTAYDIYFVAEDDAGNLQADDEVEKVDVSTVPEAPEVEGITDGSYNSDQSFTVNGKEGATIEYSLDGGNNWQEYSSEVTLTDEGESEITARQTVNRKTSASSEVINVTIDKTAP